MIKKKARFYESTGVTDPLSGLPVRTTKTVREYYRLMNPEEMVSWYSMDTGEIVNGPRKGMPNYYVSQIIEKEFASSHSKVPRDGYFGPLRDGSTGEIRFMINASSGHYDVFVSSIKEGSIDIISFQRGYLKKEGSLSGDPKWYKKILTPLWAQ